MKTKFYKTVIAVLLFPLIVFGNISNKKGKYTEQKQITKEFSVNEDALLKVNNSYGNIDVTVWDQPKTSIKVIVKVSGDEREKILQKLEGIDVSFSASPSQISAYTKFNEKSSSWWDKIAASWNSSNINVEVNYIIKVSSTNKLDLANDYGSIGIEENLGGCKINCDYGQLILGELKGDNNDINIDYCNNSTIKFLKKGTVNANYSDFSIEEAGEVTLNADYSKSTFENANMLTFNCDYGVLYLGKINTLKGNGDYLGIKVESINKALAINSDYGSITVNRLEPSLKTVMLNTDYTGVRMNYDEDLSFNFKIKTAYGSVKIDEEDVNIMKKNVGNTSKEFEGFRGERNTGAEIIISTSYGGVKFYKL